MRFVEFTTPDKDVNSFPLERFLRELFAVLAPDRPLPEHTSTERWPFREYLTAQGDGMTIDSHQGGAVFGELVEDTYSLRVDDIRFATSIIGHATQVNMAIDIVANAESIDVATDALLECAAKAGLVFVRRGERPTR